MEQLENKMVIDELYIENDATYEEYLENLLEEDDRIYEDEVWERLNGR